MADEHQPKRDEAGWNQHLETISKRNTETRKRARAAQKLRDATAAAKHRADSQREAKDLRELNARVAGLQRRRPD